MAGLKANKATSTDHFPTRTLLDPLRTTGKPNLGCCLGETLPNYLTPFVAFFGNPRLSCIPSIWLRH